MNHAAQSLGRLAKGKPKHFSPQEIERRIKLLVAARAAKALKKAKA